MRLFHRAASDFGFGLVAFGGAFAAGFPNEAAGVALGCCGGFGVAVGGAFAAGFPCEAVDGFYRGDVFGSCGLSDEDEGGCDDEFVHIISF